MYPEAEILTVRDSENGRIYRYRTEVRIGSRTGSANNLPSLLVRDLLSRHWSLLHERVISNGLEPRHSPADSGAADGTVPEDSTMTRALRFS